MPLVVDLDRSAASMIVCSVVSSHASRLSSACRVQYIAHRQET
jgi:hypothetical protein